MPENGCGQLGGATTELLLATSLPAEAESGARCWRFHEKTPRTNNICGVSDCGVTVSSSFRAVYPGSLCELCRSGSLGVVEQSQ
jgi:hypothetical protein